MRQKLRKILGAYGIKKLLKYHLFKFKYHYFQHCLLPYNIEFKGNVKLKPKTKLRILEIFLWIKCSYIKKKKDNERTDNM